MFNDPSPSPLWLRTRHGACARSASGRRLEGDDGSTSLSVVLLTPVFVTLMFAAVQAALWSHAQTEARATARDTAALVARSGVAGGDAKAAAKTVLSSDTSMTNINVDVNAGAELVTVTIAADAPGIIRGTSRPVSVTVAIPVERIIER